MNKKCIGLSLLTILLVLVGAGFWLTYQVNCQQKLNQQLIEAIKREDAHATLVALDAGADPNTHDKPFMPASVWNLFLRQIEHVRYRRSLEDHSSPSALLLAIVGKDNFHSRIRAGSGPWRLANQKIVENLLKRGAKVNVPYPDEDDWTPLLYAVDNDDTPSVRTLLRYGADPYVLKDSSGHWGLEKMPCLSEESADCRNSLEFVLKQQKIIKNP